MVTVRRILLALLLAMLMPLAGAAQSARAASAPASPGSSAGATSTPDPGWSVVPTASSKLTAGNCAQVLFVGVRGSGEPAPYGPTIADFRDALAPRAGSATVRQAYLDYPASAIDAIDTQTVEQAIFDPTAPRNAYFVSVSAGVTALTGLIASQSQACPDQRLLLVGFSQGSEVIVRTLAAHPQGPRLLAAVLLGDPVHYPGQNEVELDGTAGNRAFGLVTALTYLRSVANPFTNPTRADQVRAVVQAAVDMYQGTVDTTRLDMMMSSDGLSISGTDAPHVYSVCDTGDLVCDAAKPLARILTTASTITAERDRARPIHLGYHGAAVGNTVTAVADALARIPAQPSPTAPVAAPATIGSWLPVGLAGVAVTLVLLVVVLHLGRRFRRARSAD